MTSTLDAPPAGRALGTWVADGTSPDPDPAAFAAALADLASPVLVVQTPDGPAVARGGQAVLGVADDGLPLLAVAPPVTWADLGDPAFRRAHGLQYNYVAGAMANGIASVELVEAMSRAGMLGVFGSAGLSLGRVEQALDRLRDSLGESPYGCNLIHSPNEPATESGLVDLLLAKRVRLAEASAFLDLTPAVVRYRLTGIRRGRDGEPVCPNRVIAKVSRVEVASKFLAPAPERIVRELVSQGHLTSDQAALAARVPVATDLTAEADSGGHTDNRPLVTLLPTLLALRDRFQAQHRYAEPLRVGAAGGLSTPQGLAAAFGMGAAYVVTGSVNQACIESGSCDRVRAMLAAAEQADTIMAPAADMFEMGVKVQVLKRGTLFAMRGAKLLELYRTYSGLDAIPLPERAKLEKDVFRQPIEAIWAETRSYFQQRDPAQVTRAEADAKHKMALVFRWYLGLASRWANAGEPTRQMDYQVWCGPAMGAFNEWVRGTPLAEPANRRAAAVARALLQGAAVCTRAQMLRVQGVTAAVDLSPRLEKQED